jgi:branched-chain amino acid transport system substrate-binding protein
VTKKALAGIAAAVILLGAVTWLLYRRARHPGGERPITIGAALPLTGDGAEYGTNAKKAIDLAISEVNAAGGVRGRQLAVIYEDTKLQPKDAVSAVTKLATIDKVKVIIGPMSSSEVEAVLPVCEANHVVLVSPSATDHKLSGASPYFFRTIVSDAYEGKVMAEFAFKQKGYRRVAILYIESAGPFGVSETFRKDFEALGGQVVTIEKASQGASDLRAQLTRIKSKKVQAMFFAGFAQETVTMLKQAKEIGLNIQILAHGTAEAPEVRQDAGAAADGLIFATSTLGPDSGIDSVRKFYAAFRSRYGTDPQNYAPNAYDAAKLIATVMIKYGLDSDEIARGLRVTRDYEGATGTLTIEQDGDVEQRLRVMRISRGRLVPIQ